jgi:hypothetical protein
MVEVKRKTTLIFLRILSVRLCSLPPFAAFAQQKKRADALSARFLRAALSISRLQRRAVLRSMCKMAMSALGWELPLDAICTNGSFAQKVYFAKSHERPKTTIRVGRARCDAASPKADIDTLLQHY